METWKYLLYKKLLLIFKGAYSKDKDKHFSKACCNRKRVIGFQQKEDPFRIDVGRTRSATRVVNYWHRLPQRMVETPPRERFQVGWGSEQPCPVEIVLAHCSVAGLDDFLKAFLTQTVLWFYGVMIWVLKRALRPCTTDMEVTARPSFILGVHLLGQAHSAPQFKTNIWRIKHLCRTGVACSELFTN